MTNIERWHRSGTLLIGGATEIDLTNNGPSLATDLTVEDSSLEFIRGSHRWDRCFTPASFTAAPRTDMIATREEVEAAIENATPLIDMRSHDHYLGINHTRVVVRPGTIPAAVNLPMTWLVVNEELRFRTPDQVRILWETAGVPADAPQILFCNSALESSIGWLAANMLLGNTQAKLYDGSLAEWSADPALPMELKVPLE